MNHQNTAGIIGKSYDSIGSGGLAAQVKKSTPFSELGEAVSSLRSFRSELVEVTSRLVGPTPDDGQAAEGSKPDCGIFGEVQDATYSIRDIVKDMRSELERIRAQI